MRNQLRQIFIDKSIKYSTRFLAAILACLVFVFSGNLAVALQSSNDAPQWYFDVELIVFKRTMLPSNNEDFSKASFDVDFTQSNQLLYLAAIQQLNPFNAYHESLPSCQTPDVTALTKDIDINFQYKSAATYYPNDATANNLPDTIGTAQRDEQASVEPPVNTAQNNETTEVDEPSLIDVSMFESNQSLMEYLLSPFPTNTTTVDASALHSELSVEAQTQNVTSNNTKNTLENASHAYSTNQIVDDNTLQADSLTLAPEDIEYFKARLNQATKTLKDAVKRLEPQSLSILCKQAITPSQDLTQQLASIPQSLFATTEFFTGHIQMLPENNLALKDYAQQVFKQRDIKQLLHTAWRQEVAFGEQNAEFVRVRAGQLLTAQTNQTYEQWLLRQNKAQNEINQSDDDSFFQDLQLALDNNEVPNWLNEELLNNIDEPAQQSKKQAYELEGLFKVYLDYVNQIPYLHIDSEFMHYRLNIDENGNSEFSTYPFKQRRRIISKQIHYFDHPAFGMIVRLQRFTPPKVETQEVSD